MSLVIVHDYIRDAINAKLDAATDREELYRQLLTHFNETGIVPDFSLKKTT